MSSALRKRFTSLLIPTLVLAVLLHEFLTTPVYTERELASMRESAVALARQGDVETALEKLRALSEVAPDDRAIWGDYLTEVVRAGRERDALELYRQHRAKALPDYALAELFDAALRQRDIELARELADRESAQSRDRDNVADARKRALMAAELASEQPHSETPATITPIAQTALANTAQSVHENNRVTPKTESARDKPRSTNSVFRRENTSQQSTARSQQIAAPSASPEKHASTETLEPTLGDRARNAVRNIEQAPAAERAALAEQALPLVDEYVASLPSESVEARNAKLDRVSVLTHANRLDEAAALFESLGDAQTLPIFGLLNGADLYARRHEPARAEALLDIVLAREPRHRSALRAKFYAQLDRGDRAGASATLDRLRETAVSNEEHFADRLLAVTFAIDSNDLPKAQSELEKLSTEIPDSAEVHERLGQIYRWRGWPRRALAEYERAEQLGGATADLHLAKSAAYADAHHFAAARAELENAEKNDAQHPGLGEARQQQRNRSRWEYEARALVGRSPDSTVNTDGDRRFEQRLWSPLLNDRWRAFAHHRYDWAEFPYEEEGTARLDRYGVGAALYLPIVDASFEIHNRRPDAEIGFDVSGEWHLDDRIGVFAEYQSDSDRVPLRAFNDGVDGHSLSVGSNIRVDENRAARFAYARTDFSDSNTRQTLAASYRQTLYRNAGREFNATAQMYEGRNSGSNDVFYFNPSRERAITATLEYGAPLWAGEISSWSHRVAVGGGMYRQRDYSSEPIWDIEYEQRWRVNAAFDINYGALHRSRVYDGERESYNALFGGINWRF